jgi:hypothetical protein
MIRPTRLEDIEAVFSRRIDEWEDSDLDSAEARIAAAAICYTVLDKEEPIAIIGASAPVNGCSHAWACFTDRAAGKALLLARTARRIMREGYRDYPVKYVLTWHRPGFDKGRRWLEMLGFRRVREIDCVGEDSILREGYCYGCF